MMKKLTFFSTLIAAGLGLSPLCSAEVTQAVVFHVHESILEIPWVAIYGSDPSEGPKSASQGAPNPGEITVAPFTTLTPDDDGNIPENAEPALAFSVDTVNLTSSTASITLMATAAHVETLSNGSSYPTLDEGSKHVPYEIKYKGCGGSAEPLSWNGTGTLTFSRSITVGTETNDCTTGGQLDFSVPAVLGHLPGGADNPNAIVAGHYTATLAMEVTAT
jgi:hypothetical protein